MLLLLDLSFDSIDHATIYDILVIDRSWHCHVFHDL